MSRLRQEELLLTELRAAFARSIGTASPPSPSGASEVLILSRGISHGIWRCGDGHILVHAGAATGGGDVLGGERGEEAVHATLEHVCGDGRENRRRRETLRELTQLCRPDIWCRD